MVRNKKKQGGEQGMLEKTGNAGKDRVIILNNMLGEVLTKKMTLGKA